MHDIRPFLPEPFEKPGSLLYIGYRQDACAWLQELADNTITVLEIWPNNVTGALDDERVETFWVGDVRRVDELPDMYDYVFWWHGPEHIEKDQWIDTLKKLQAKANLIAIAAPWGVYEQGPHNGNPHETHLWSVYEIDFIDAGLEIHTDGEPDQPGSELVGIWRNTELFGI